ncbi:MAG: calcium/proton exchanger [archaeon]
MLTKYLRLDKHMIILLLFIPFSVYSGFVLKNSTLTFISAAISLIPLAMIIGFATRDISLQANPRISGLVSATFGNIIELMVAIFALSRGLIELVRASLIGSIICNIVLLTGLGFFVGGLKYKHQRFNKEAIGVSATMLIIAIVGLTMPTVFAFTTGEHQQAATLSNIVALVMAVIYTAGLVFSLRTHKDLFDENNELKASLEKPVIGKGAATIILFITTAFVALMADLLSRSIEPAALNLGLSQTFIGVVIIAIISNVAEISTAIRFAREDRLDVSLEIGMSSASQIALFVVPILVLISHLFGFGFSLVFSLFQVLGVILAVVILNHLMTDGRCNWLEGAQLISVYMIIAIAFFFI